MKAFWFLLSLVVFSACSNESPQVKSRITYSAPKGPESRELHFREEYTPEGSIKEEWLYVKQPDGTPAIAKSVYEYDSEGRLIRKTADRSNGEWPTVYNVSQDVEQYEYNDRGLMSKWLKPDHEGRESYVEYSYNDRGDKTEAHLFTEGENLYNTHFEHHYDERDSLIEWRSWTYWKGDTEPILDTNWSTYAFDDRGRRIQERHSADYKKSEQVYTFTYNDEDQVIIRKQLFPDGGLWEMTEYEYDADGNVVREVEKDSKQEVRYTRLLQYDNNGNLIRWELHKPEESTPWIKEYEYEFY